MSRDDVLRILAEFFRDQLAEDPIGVGDWFAQGGNDIDAFMEELYRWHPGDSADDE